MRKSRVLFFCILFVPMFSPSSARAATACENNRATLRALISSHGSAQYIAILRRSLKYACSPQYLREEAIAQQRQQQESEAAAGAFLSGFIGGFIDSYNPGGAGRVSSPRYHSAGAPRANFHVNTVHTQTSAPVHINNSQSTIRTSTVSTHTSSTPATRSSSSVSNSSQGSGPITSIRQPNGTLDPVYSKPPCLTTQRTGPTSYKCTNN
jgi:hypothetical protein